MLFALSSYLTPAYIPVPATKKEERPRERGQEEAVIAGIGAK